jgi:hypothetical protein
LDSDAAVAAALRDFMRTSPHRISEPPAENFHINEQN